MSDRVKEVIATTCRHYRFGIRELRDQSHYYHIVRARHVAMYLAHELTGANFSLIGKELVRDRSTVHHAVYKIRRLLADGHPIAADVEAIRAELETVLNGEVAA